VQRAAVHEDLSDNRQTRVDDLRLVNVEQKLWILDDVHPETQQQAATTRANDQSTETLQTKPLYCFAVICGQNAISMFWGNTAYCVKFSSEDLSRYANKIELVGLRNIRIITILLRNVVITNTSHDRPYHGESS